MNRRVGLALILSLLSLASCSAKTVTVVVSATSSVTSTTTSPSATTTSASPDETTTEAAETTTPPPPRYIPKASEWVVGIKILKKECFGSAGCNLIYRINPQLIGTQDVASDTKLEVTYVVKGGDSGPVINTFTTDGGQSSVDTEETISTVSSTTKLTAKVTDVNDISDS